MAPGGLVSSFSHLQNDISVIHCSCFPMAVTTNLSSIYTYGSDGLCTRNDTFVDSELLCYTGQITPLLQLPKHSSTRKVIQVISSNHISQKNSLELAAKVFICTSDFPFIVVLSCACLPHKICLHSRHLTFGSRHLNIYHLYTE
ncbi:hypothetical protein TNCV_2565851 [Trichonephila clavipes]|nr:hypothetical protein TNCV_2565851 [Trichonephila clavipes]